MMKSKLGQEPAFPHPSGMQDGMSKRFYAACAAMQGLLSSSYYNLHDHSASETYCKKAYLMADELLKQEKEEEDEVL